MNSAITVKDIGKRYRIGIKEHKGDGISDRLKNLLRSPFINLKRLRSLSSFVKDDESVFWALREVSFEVREGEVMGIIGHNGAGKSTLLKILSRITEPTKGEVKIVGRVSSLLEVGTGFHPDLTGRENIYMNGTILGMRKREIDRKLDDIVDFSGVSTYLDTPVKRYSSGMKVRLGFSVAAHLEPDVLIVDEVLAVGDFEFQNRCLGKMQEVGKSGRTVLFVSHNMTAVSNLCSRCLLLRDSRIEYLGSTQESIARYFGAASTLAMRNDLRKVPRNGVRMVSFESIEIKSMQGDRIKSGDDISISIDYAANIEGSWNLSIALHFYNHLGNRIFVCSPNFKGTVRLEGDRGSVCCKIRRLPLPAGTYSISIWSEVNSELNEVIEGALNFETFEGDFYRTGKSIKATRSVAVLMDSEWNYNTL
jgi:lipopolysaccharide transport system ATP-binding protein